MTDLTVAMGQLAAPLMASYRGQFTPGKMRRIYAVTRARGDDGNLMS